MIRKLLHGSASLFLAALRDLAPYADLAAGGCRTDRTPPGGHLRRTRERSGVRPNYDRRAGTRRSIWTAISIERLGRCFMSGWRQSSLELWSGKRRLPRSSYWTSIPVRSVPRGVPPMWGVNERALELGCRTASTGALAKIVVGLRSIVRRRRCCSFASLRISIAARGVQTHYAGA